MYVRLILDRSFIINVVSRTVRDDRVTTKHNGLGDLTATTTEALLDSNNRCSGELCSLNRSTPIATINRPHVLNGRVVDRYLCEIFDKKREH